MRIWSIHPKYLDVKGLLALWREALLAKNVLEHKTQGYRHHPQLTRFKNAQDPLKSINFYLQVVYDEATNRGYKFNPDKFVKVQNIQPIPVTQGQINYEVKHLLTKLATRDPIRYQQIKDMKFETHPLFYMVAGDIEPWEKVS